MGQKRLHLRRKKAVTAGGDFLSAAHLGQKGVRKMRPGRVSIALGFKGLLPKRRTRHEVPVLIACAAGHERRRKKKEVTIRAHLGALKQEDRSSLASRGKDGSPPPGELRSQKVTAWGGRAGCRFCEIAFWSGGRENLLADLEQGK